MSFMDKLKETWKEQKAYTENGALGFYTTGKYLLDFNFKIPSFQHESEQEIINSFLKAYYEEKETALIYFI